MQTSTGPSRSYSHDIARREKRARTATLVALAVTAGCVAIMALVTAIAVGHLHEAQRALASAQEMEATAAAKLARRGRVQQWVFDTFRDTGPGAAVSGNDAPGNTKWRCISE